MPVCGAVVTVTGLGRAHARGRAVRSQLRWLGTPCVTYGAGKFHFPLLPLSLPFSRAGVAYYVSHPIVVRVHAHVSSIYATQRRADEIAKGYKANWVGNHLAAADPN